jgi:hypothetical protein
MTETVARSLHEVIRAMPKPARARLNRYVCFCDARLSEGHCCATGPACSRATMLDRMSRCLAESRLPEVRKVAGELADEALRM